MAENFGTGVSRTLDALDRSFSHVVWQQGKPPMDAEFNLVTQMSEELRKEWTRAKHPSGWLDPNAASPYEIYGTDENNSNLFWFGVQDTNEYRNYPVAVVNGWVVPVVGSNNANADTDPRNVLKLSPPPSADNRTDFVFLEVWESQLSPATTLNKPSSTTIWRFGNVLWGGTNLPDDLIDPTVGFETAERVQVQYRLRVTDNVNPISDPEGMSSNLVLAQGGMGAVSAFNYINMKDEMGDAGLWRAGNGDPNNGLNTTSGYVYAIPIGFVFRRNTQGFKIYGDAEHNGADDRNPTATTSADATTFTEVSLLSDITFTELSLPVTSTVGSFLSGATYLQIDDEVMQIDSFGGSTITIASGGRGQKDTHATAHLAGAVVKAWTDHPKGLFADQIDEKDILDLRHLVGSPEDYEALLMGNLRKLLSGQLRSTWKQAEDPNSRGSRTFNADQMRRGPGPATPPTGVNGVDGPDGLRRIFSDSAALQPDNVMFFLGTHGSGDTASILADYEGNPSSASAFLFATNSWSVGDQLTVPMDQYRNSFREPASNNEKVRWVHPDDYSSGYVPLKLYVDCGNTSAHRKTQVYPASDYPTVAALGGVLTTGATTHSGTDGVVGPTAHAAATDQFSAASASFPAPYGDPANELVGKYLVISGDTASIFNNGCFRILDVIDANNLQVETFNGFANDATISTDPLFTDKSSQDWALRDTAWGLQDEEIVLTFLANDVNTWSFTDLEGLFVSYTMLYQGGRGLSRVPDSVLRVVGDALDTTYLKEESSVVTGQKRFASSPLATFARSGQGGVPGSVDREGELFVDPGSKTVLLQPVRRADASMRAETDPTTDLVDDFVLFDPENVWTADTDRTYMEVPMEMIPGFGRQDFPARTTSDVNWIPGVNWMFRDLIGGTPSNVNYNMVIPRFHFVVDGAVPYRTGSGGLYGTSPGVGARIFSPANTIPSEDLGTLDTGIELPPFYGVARIMGIYAALDFDANGSAFDADRVTPRSGATNLLNLKANKGTLYFNQDGFATDQHTVVIPREMVDISLLNGSAYAISDFTTGSYVVEAAVFAFAEGFGSSNGRIIARRNNTWQGSLPKDNLAHTYSMCLTMPAADGDEFYVVSDRIPYQGDPFGTRGITAENYEDYDFRVGDVTSSQSYTFGNEQLPQDTLTTPNPRAFEVLAAASFFTTLGTGSMTGHWTLGSYGDVGGVCPLFNRIATDPNDPPVPLYADLTEVDLRRAGGFNGATERLPVGILFADKDFLGEGLGGRANLSLVQGIQSNSAGDIFTDAYRADGSPRLSFLGQMGEVIAMADGNPGSDFSNAQERYRTYRGGSAWLMTKGGEGNVLTWQTGSTPGTQTLNGVVLSGIAMLVRNFKEEAFSPSPSVTTYGDELQMVIVTTAIGVGSPTAPRAFSGIMGPTGWGEGFSAAERYRLEGHPMVAGKFRLPPDVENVDFVEFPAGTDPVIVCP